MLSKTQAAELKKRRRSLMKVMGEGSIAILSAAPVAPRNRDSEYAYRQDGNFYYLSGFDEPESLMVLIPGRKAGEFIMFCREKDPLQETWHGRRLGVNDATEVLGADHAFPITDIDDILPGLMEGRKHVYHTLGKNQTFDAQLLGWLQNARSKRTTGDDPDSFISLDYHLHEMRVHKSRNEIGIMRRASKLTAAALTRTMLECKPGMMEYELEAVLIHEYTRNGACHAFLPIVGGGENGCILHYNENNRELVDGELVLIDTGAEVEYYAGDITRTFPINGKFTEAQADVYNVVLNANLAGIEAAKPGSHWSEPHEAAVKVLTAGLRTLGILKGTLSKLIKDKAYLPYYMHRTGHWLGSDVHDVGEYKVDTKWRELEPGMVLTIEPGLYLTDDKSIPKQYRNIGIRIEDDVLITKDGNEILSKDVPKHVDDIESLMSDG